MSIFKKGDKITFTYTHSLNRRSKTQITKKGVFVRWVKSKGVFPHEKQEQRAIVKLDGNKTESVVLKDKIQHA